MKTLSLGAHIERRGDVGPVRSLLGGKDLTGRFLMGSGYITSMPGH
jgi:hypothetical protein